MTRALQVCAIFLRLDGNSSEVEALELLGHGPGLAAASTGVFAVGGTDSRQQLTNCELWPRGCRGWAWLRVDAPRLFHPKIVQNSGGFILMIVLVVVKVVVIVSAFER